ncbi:hypothetical protein BCR39DRAFT_522337 [Naematelia encephala]|uniref:Uncharacterized protein n=1 Tax=Naematelia encephala TaxID=71784 RepID=A0A1Y2BDW0_9TREE|nr:hypothetical protein BCR39DRAFT_522337 [Naematelia encephala]
MCYGSFFSLSMMSNPTGTYLKKHEETLGNPYNYSSLQNLVNNKDLRFAAMVEEGNRHACLMVVMGKNMFLKSGTSTECVPFGAESVIYLRIDGQTHARPTFTGIAQYRSQTVPDQDWLETLRQTTHENLKAYVEYDRSFEVSNAFAVWGFINRLRDSHSDFSQGMTKALELPSSIVLQSSLDPSSRYLSSMEAR